MFDYSKLRGRIREILGTQSAFAKLLNISEATLSKKLNNDAEFTQGEMNLSSEVLNFPLSEIPVYFFNPKV
jgi:transcriptional regulator with XRE-family HTH domain